MRDFRWPRAATEPRVPLIALTSMALMLGSVGCGHDASSEPPPGLDGDKTPQTEVGPGWANASSALHKSPAPRGIVMDAGFPSELSRRPTELSAPDYRPWTSGRALAADEHFLYAVDTENGALLVHDRASGEPVRRVFLGSRPAQVVVNEAGVAFVTLRHGHAVARISAESDTPVLAHVGHEPVGLALSWDQSTLFVVVRSEGAVVALDAGSLSELARVTGLDRPRSITASNTGDLYVGGRGDHVDVLRFGGGSYGQPDLLHLAEAPLRRGNPADITVHPGRADRLQPNRTMALTIHPETGSILAVHHLTQSGDEEAVLMAVKFEAVAMDFPEFPAEGGHSAGYGSGSNQDSKAPHITRPIEVSVSRVAPNGAVVAPWVALPVQDPESLEPVTALLAQPSDIHHHPKWNLAMVTGYGSDNVLVLNTASEDPMRDPLGLIWTGQAPAAVAFSPDGRIAYTLNDHEFTISEIDLTPFFAMSPKRADARDSFAFDAEHAVDAGEQRVAPINIEHRRTLRFATDPLPENARLGRRVFTYAFNSSLSADNRFACRSCHIDGAEDGLVWFITDGPRQTPALAGRVHDTGPFNWVGSEMELLHNMERTIERMGGEGLNADELASLEQFLLVGLTPPPNPHRSTEGLTAQQLRGEAIFNDPTVGCAGCHGGVAQTDGRLHDVGTATELEHNVAQLRADVSGEPVVAPTFNTPTLRGLHATAPYLHDGSAATLHEVLERTATTMGRTDHLSPEERDDLVAYLLTL